MRIELTRAAKVAVSSQIVRLGNPYHPLAISGDDAKQFKRLAATSASSAVSASSAGAASSGLA